MLTRSVGFSTILRRAYSQVKSGGSAQSRSGSAGVSPSSTPSASVTGLTSNCVKPTSGPVGPGAAVTGDYKVPEYFSFNRFSYAEAEVEMAKYRCPQPSALKK